MKTVDAGGFSVGSVLRQLRMVFPTLMLLFGVIVAAGLILILVHYSSDENVTILVKDPREFTGLPFRTGIYSNIGILILWSVAIITLVFGVFARSNSRTRELAGMLIVFGLLHGFLAIDDLLMIHEELGLILSKALGTDDIIERRSQLEGIVFVVYGIAWLWWAWRFRSAIAKTAWLLLALGMAGFVGSVVIDVGSYLFPEHIPWYPWMPTTLDLGDEMMKLAGYIMLAGWAWWSARQVWTLATEREDVPELEAGTS